MSEYNPQETSSCEWTEDFDGNWEVECGGMFSINEGSPSENKMAFCCYCGKLLKEIRYEIHNPSR